MINMLKDIPLEYMEISDCVIKEAKVDLEVDDSLYISLTDHIHTSIERYKEGVYLKIICYLKLRISILKNLS